MNDRTAAYYTIGLAKLEGADAVEPQESTHQMLRGAPLRASMTRLYCDGPTLLRAVAAAVANLERHVEEVDSLNVFPVPDGDTGSNMLATMRAALVQAEELPEHERSLRQVAAALRHGALTGARGNSGVILSQIIRGMTDGTGDRRWASGIDLAEGLRRGSEVAYESVLTPVEGTILTVIRDAASAAEAAAGQQRHVESVLAITIEAAARSVESTPTLLPVLEDAGVVDSGGQGLFRLLEGAMQVDGPARPSSRSMPVVADGPPSTEARTEVYELQGHPQHGYETEFVVAAEEGELDLEAMRTELRAVGESIIVAGDERVARVHVHGVRPDLAIGIGVRWGRLGNVSVKDLDAQIAALAPRAAASSRSEAEPRGGIAMVAVSPADGLAAVLAGLGARVIRPAHGSRPSVGEIAGGILAAGSPEVLVLPNDRDAHLAAGQAASLTPLVAVSIVPTRNAAEGIAAALAFDADQGIAANAEAMEAAAAALRSFDVTVAARGSVIDGIEIHVGEAIALDAGRTLLATADSVEGATLKALASLRTDDAFELVTCYRGAGLDESLAEGLARRISEHFDGVEVEVITGGQQPDHLLVAVE